MHQDRALEGDEKAFRQSSTGCIFYYVEKCVVYRKVVFIHIPTIFVTFLLVSIATVLMILPLWYSYRKKYGGIGYWALDHIFLLVANSLVLLRGLVPDFIGFFLSNFFYLFSGVMMLVGLSRFTGIRINVRNHAVLIIAAMTVWSYYFWVEPDINIRTFILYAILMIQAVHALYHLRHRIDPGLSRYARPFLGALILYIVPLLVQMSAIVIAPVSPTAQLARLSGLSAIVLIWLQFGTLLIGISIFYFVIARLKLDLAANEERFRIFTEFAPSAIFILNQAGDIIFCNQIAAELVNCRRTQVIGSHFRQFVAPACFDLVSSRFRDRQNGVNSPWCYEMTVRQIDGTEVECELRAAVYRGADGIVYSIAQLIDITHRKELEARLAQYQRSLEQTIAHRTAQLVQAEKLSSLGTMAAGLAHEINNPDNYILMNAETLLKGAQVLSTPAVLQELSEHHFVDALPLRKFLSSMPFICRDIIDGAKRIAVIVDAMKQYSLPADATTLCTISVRETIQRAILLSRKTLEKRKCRVMVNGDTDFSLKTSISALEQILINLIENSAVALVEGGEIIIAFCGSGSITISDRGCGIPQENLHRLGEPFFTTHRQDGGTGLGLFIVQHILKEIGGTMDVKSEPGNGTAVTLSFSNVQEVS